ncbi:hypothetical protein [Duganella sp. BuS-21]|uniref:hypothetical protein n=1 Tax=Duganella sp. BuS-21 TaxID=2943848 RepID=UPI0035A6179D
MSDFIPIIGAAPSVGLVLRTGTDPKAMLRITHSFQKRMFALWVSTPAMARKASRPQQFSLAQLEELASAEGAAWGQLTLPSRLCTPPIADSEEANRLEERWQLIRPLVEAVRLLAGLTLSV